MTEKTRVRPEQPTFGSDGLGDIFAPNAAVTPVMVAHGPYSERLPVGGMTVGEIRSRYRDRFDIDPRSHPVLDGHDVDNNTVVRAGQVLTFVRRAGEKGSCE
jgi:hypothetical protein